MAKDWRCDLCKQADLYFHPVGVPIEPKGAPEKEKAMSKAPWTAHPYNESMGSLISWGDISRGEVVAIVHAQRNPAEGKANARLIAAAPEILEVLKEMVADDAFAELCQGIGEEPSWLKLARAAIAKAQMIEPKGAPEKEKE
jgi:hypothetical protein